MVIAELGILASPLRHRRINKHSNGLRNGSESDDGDRDGSDSDGMNYFGLACLLWFRRVKTMELICK